MQPNQKTVICSEQTKPSKKIYIYIQFIVGPNTTYIKQGLVFVAKQSIHGSASQSILKYGQYIQTINLSDKQINNIIRQFPDFALNQFEQWDFG